MCPVPLEETLISAEELDVAMIHFPSVMDSEILIAFPERQTIVTACANTLTGQVKENGVDVIL